MRPKKAIMGLLLSTMLLGSAPVCAAESNKTPVASSTTAENRTEGENVVTKMSADEFMFSLSGESDDFGDKFNYNSTIYGAYVKGGKWIKGKKGWWYRMSDGTYPKNAAIIISAKEPAAITSWKDFTSFGSKKRENRTLRYIDIAYDGTYTTQDISFKNGSTTYGEKTECGKYTEKIYLFDNEGYLITNRFERGHWINSNGELRAVTGKYGGWRKSNNRWWYRTEDGSYLRSGYYTIWNNKLASSGKLTKGDNNGSINKKEKGCVYYFDDAGYLVTNQFIDTDNVWEKTQPEYNKTLHDLTYYWINEDGSVDMGATYVWHNDKQGWQFKSAHWLATGGAYHIGDKYYTFDKNGYAN